MLSRFKFLLVTTFGVLFMGAMLVPSQHVSAALFENSKTEACNGIALSSGTTCSDQGSNVSNVLKAALQLASIAIGVIAVIMIITSGLKYITSQGDAASITSAKNTLLYAIIGLVIVAFAQVIVHFVLTKTKSLPTCPKGTKQIVKPGDCTP